MKKFTLLIALFVCAIGFSQTGSLTNWADSNPSQLEANTSNRRTLVSSSERNGGTVTFTLLADFLAACTDPLTSEDFSNGPGGITDCGLIVSSAGDGCFPPGELEDGFDIQASTVTTVIYIDAGLIGNTSVLMGANTFTEFTIINFTGADDVTSVAMDIWNNSDPDTDYRVYDTGGVLVETFGLNNTVATENFFGIITEYAIGHIEIEGLIGSGELYGNFLFGDCGGSSGGGTFPEILYYTFDEAGSNLTENFADPGSGFAFAELFGGMTMGSTGQVGSALVGTGVSSSTDYVDTGWILDIGTSDWTISLWLDIFDESALHYVFGEQTTNFRCFYGGVAPVGGVVLRGTGVTDVPATGLIPGPGVVHFVYDSSVPEIRAYVNGVFQSAVGQTALNLIGTEIFKVGSKGTSVSLAAGELLDEFRFYNRALDAAEIDATWNITIVPVELTSFTASVNDNDVTLSWETATELNNSGFEIERKSAAGEYDKLGFVPGFGTTTEPRAYSFSDVNLLPGTYTYRLKQIDYDGTFEYSDPVEVDIVVPDVYSLHQNYPNPFNPSTKITFTLAANAQVTLKVFDVLGQEIMTLINQDITAGVHTYDFDAAGINSGVYFYRIEANGIDGTNFTNVKKMILLK